MNFGGTFLDRKLLRSIFRRFLLNIVIYKRSIIVLIEETNSNEEGWFEQAKEISLWSFNLSLIDYVHIIYILYIIYFSLVVSENLV